MHAKKYINDKLNQAVQHNADKYSYFFKREKFLTPDLA